MSAKASRGAKILERLVANKLATEDAVQAVLNLVDPFPDDDIRPVAWPDGFAAPAVPAVFRSELPITAPAGLAAGATWDAHILCRPFLASSNAPWTAANANSVAGQVITTGTVMGNGPFMFEVVTAPTGTLPAPDTTAWQTARVIGVSPNAVLTPDPGNLLRVNSMGVEAVNTSADLYRGGMGFAYRLPSLKMDLQFQAPASEGTVPYIMRTPRWTVAPPTSPGDIVNLTNTYSGDSRNGVVWVGAPNSVQENDFVTPSPSVVAYISNPLGSTITPAVIPLVWNVMNVPKVEWQTGGIFLTGQPANASYVIKMRCFGELAASAGAFAGGVLAPQNLLLQALAKRGSPVSPSLMEVLTSLEEYLPAGFDYAENPFGEWFDKVLRVVADVAPTVGKALGVINPAFGMVGQGVGKLAGMAHEYRAPEKLPPASKGQQMPIPQKKKKKKKAVKAA